MQNNAEPLVQIIIPTYKRPALFKEALLSALAQTYKNIRIFITDNSDDDETELLMRPFLELDPRITYEHHPEYNEQDNWNRGMEMTDPEAVYVNWLMDDDLFFPTKIAEMVAAFQSHKNLSLVTSSRLHIDLNGQPIPDLGTPNLPVSGDTLIPGSGAALSILTEQCNYIGEPTTPLIRRDCLLNGHDLGWTGKEGRYFLSDIPTWLHVLEHGDLYFIKKPLSAFRLHGTQVGKKMHFIISVQGTWAYLIHHAVTAGIYLTAEDDIRRTLEEWLKGTAAALAHADNNGYTGEDVDTMRSVYENMKAALDDSSQMHSFSVPC